MVVPIIQEPVKNKELLIEVDSIVTDNKDLANVSLSSNDSLGKSRRKWRLIRIINKLNPALTERKYKFPIFKFLFALFLIILTSLILYWSLSPRAVIKPDCPSSIPLNSPAQVPPREHLTPTKVLKVSPFTKPNQNVLFTTTEAPQSSLFSIPYFVFPDYDEIPMSDIEDGEDLLNDLPDMENDVSFYYPSRFQDSFNDLSDTFSLRSSSVNTDAVLESVDRFVSFFKSMIDF